MATADYVYHWTHISNLPSIARCGLNLTYCETKVKAIWVGTASRLGWGLCHISARHGWSPDEMVLIRVRVSAVQLSATATPGVYLIHKSVPPSKVSGYRFGVLGEWCSLRKVSKDTAPASRPRPDTSSQDSAPVA